MFWIYRKVCNSYQSLLNDIDATHQKIYLKDSWFGPVFSHQKIGPIFSITSNLLEKILYFSKKKIHDQNEKFILCHFCDMSDFLS